MMRTTLLAVAALALVGCTKTPAYLYGRDFTSLVFHAVLRRTSGIHPDRSVLDDPNNPFATDPPTDDGKWVLEANAGPVAAFYSWATINANNPYGEAQFYAAHDLQQIFRTGQASAERSAGGAGAGDPRLSGGARLFPDERHLRSRPGKIAFQPGDDGLQGIVGLGGTVQGGWKLIKARGRQRLAVKP